MPKGNGFTNYSELRLAKLITIIHSKDEGFFKLVFPCYNIEATDNESGYPCSFTISNDLTTKRQIKLHEGLQTYNYGALWPPNSAESFNIVDRRQSKLIDNWIEDLNADN